METAVDWGIELAFDHHESVFEELLGEFKGDEYWLALERAKDTISEIWEAGKEYLKIKKEAKQITDKYSEGSIELGDAYEDLWMLFAPFN